jgi:glutathione peroxidase
MENMARIPGELQGFPGNLTMLCGELSLKGKKSRRKGNAMRTILAIVLALVMVFPSAAAEPFRFASIDGGEIDLSEWRGKPVLVVNTASLCGYVGQFDALQALHQRFGNRALILAVPSNDFNQELADEAAVKEYCAVNFDLTLPMTEITPVRGRAAHPFYAWVREQTGFQPRWNFNKVLIAPDGHVAGTWGAGVKPESAEIAGRIQAMLK